MIPKRKTLLVLAGLALALYLSHSFILTGLARWLVVSDKLKPAEAIVVLAGDSRGERVEAAAGLYKKIKPKYFLVSGGPLYWHLTYAELMKKQAALLGVPASAILLEDNSESTLENAWYSLEILREKGVKRIILVTSANHTRRAKKTFAKVFGKYEIEVLSYPAPDSKFKIEKWWLDHEATQLVVWEYISLIFYFLKGQ